MQEAAVFASESVGWPASRFVDTGTAFVVRELRAVHYREARYGEELRTRTCIAEARRGILLRRETWVGDVMRASVQWAHVDAGGAPVRAGPALLDAFTAEEAPEVELPSFDPCPAEALPRFELEPWYTEMDPLGHTNHPRYVDWADEALARALAARGEDPLQVVPIAEQLRFRGSARAGDAVNVQLTLVGGYGDVDVYDVHITARGVLACEGRIWRSVPG